jgi:DNA invertase Pin-like site-specific DNA recombinase
LPSLPPKTQSLAAPYLAMSDEDPDDSSSLGTIGLAQRQAFVTVLDPHFTTRGEAGRIVMTVLGMVAQMERRFIRERQLEGIERAKSEGTYRGGKWRLDYAEVRAMHTAGHGPSAIARAIGCSRMQVYRILEGL